MSYVALHKIFGLKLGKSRFFNEIKLGDVCNDMKLASICNDIKLSAVCSDTKLTGDRYISKPDEVRNGTKLAVNATSLI